MLSRLKHLNVFLKDPDKKSLLQMAGEMLHFAIAKKTWPVDYFRKFLYRTPVKDYLDYLSLREYYSIIDSPKLQIPEINSILENKLSFARYAENAGLPVPETLGHNFKENFVLNEQITVIKATSELTRYFETLFENNNISRLFIKQIKGYGGFGYILLKKESFSEQIEAVKEALLNNNYVHQKYIRQHPEINTINPHAVNTLRLDTYIDEDQNIHVLSALMRFGVGISYTDNTHTGGFYVGIDAGKGTLKRIGHQDVVEGGRQFTKHPGSGVVLEGFQVPYYKEACALAKRASSLLPNGIVGWDIAITEEGPVIVEGNERPSLHVTDVAYGGYLKHPVIKKILKRVNGASSK